VASICGCSADILQLGYGQLMRSLSLLEVAHQLRLEGRLAFLAVKVHAPEVALQVTLDLVLQKGRVTLVRLLLLIQQKLCQKDCVLSLILLQFFVKILVLLYFVVEHLCHLIQLVLEFLILGVHLFDVLLHFCKLSFLLESALLSRFTVLNEPLVLALL